MRILTTLLVCLGSAALASAGLITTAPGTGTTTTYPGGNSCEGASSATVGGFPMTADDNWCHDYSDNWGLNGNGDWNGLSLVGNNTATTTILIDLGGLYSSVGGFMNYAPVFGNPATITALAADGVTVLETYNLETDAPISTPGGLNEGAFRGIQRATADIRFFQFGGDYLVMHDITLDTTESQTGTPEPATLSLVGGALAALVMLRRKRK